MQAFDARFYRPILGGATVAVGIGGFLFGPIGAGSVAGAFAALGFFGVAIRYANEPRPTRILPRNQLLNAGAIDVAVASEAEAKPEDETVIDWRNLILASILSHMVFAVIFNLPGILLGNYVAPDSRLYWDFGRALDELWRGDPSLSLKIGSFDAISFYQNLNGLVVYFFRIDSRMLLSVFNSLPATGVALLSASMAGRLYDAKAAKYAFMLCAFFPSLFLWSTLNLRDVWSWLTILMIANSAIHIRERFSVKHLVLLTGSMAFMYFIRKYMVPICALGVLLSFFVIRMRQLPYAVASLAVMTGLILLFGDSIGLTSELLSEQSLETMQVHRTGLTQGGSAFEFEGDVSTASGALAYLPTGMMRFLLSPFPWEARSILQIIAVPETLYWYYLLYAAGKLLWSERSRFALVAVPFFIAVVISVSYAMVEGNGGTAYRHRAQIFPLVFILSAGFEAKKRWGKSLGTR